MNKSNFKKNIMMKIIYDSLMNLPTPLNISIWWNFGSLLGMCLMTQIISGLFLSMHYCPEINLAFMSVIHIIQDINLGWLMRLIHMNGASMFFVCMYLHTGRGIYYQSYKFKKTWIMGVLIFLMTMATAFMGYVLPWGQMSFWGATVITNLVSTIPYIGLNIVQWLWGGFSINNPTLNRFYSIHFIMPMIITIMVIMHLMFLHETGSNNPLGINSNLYKIPFNIYFSLKDIYGMIMTMAILMIMTLMTPFMLSDPENFIIANPMNTPPHIQPEWYFLFAYTILRSIPNKLGGVVALIMSILILMTLPFFNYNNMQSLSMYPINQMMFWLFINNMILLTWLGAQPVESPYMEISQYLTFTYFSFYLMNPILMKLWDKIIY
nr:cytochrome b [Odontocolon albotibiale]